MGQISTRFGGILTTCEPRRTSRANLGTQGAGKEAFDSQTRNAVILRLVIKPVTSEYGSKSKGKNTRGADHALHPGRSSARGNGVRPGLRYHLARLSELLPRSGRGFLPEPAQLRSHRRRHRVRQGGHPGRRQPHHAGLRQGRPPGRGSRVYRHGHSRETGLRGAPLREGRLLTAGDALLRKARVRYCWPRILQSPRRRGPRMGTHGEEAISFSIA